MEIKRKIEAMIAEIEDAMEYAEATDTAFTREYAHIRRVKTVLQIALPFANRIGGGATSHV